MTRPTARGPASREAIRLAIETGLPLGEAERRIARWRWRVAVARLENRRGDMPQGTEGTGQ